MGAREIKVKELELLNWTENIVFNDTATTEIYTLSLHDALPIFVGAPAGTTPVGTVTGAAYVFGGSGGGWSSRARLTAPTSEEHTSELQSRQYLVCRLLLEKKYSLLLEKTTNMTPSTLVS